MAIGYLADVKIRCLALGFAGNILYTYNVLGIPIAMGALYPFFGIVLSPLLVGAAMAFLSVTAVGNANRLRAYRPRCSASH